MTGDGDYPAPFVVDVLNTGQCQILWCSSMFKNTGNMTRLVEASEKVGNKSSWVSAFVGYPG
jgi:hypothetical protein